MVWPRLLLQSVRHCRHHSQPKRWLSKQVIQAEKIDPQQLALLSEPCILVDENDTNIGAASKKDCHLMHNGTSLLHRAFSVFLFNSSGELLVHRRSDAKITFPGHYTNTCCSHPLHIPQEIVEENAQGIRVAAQRRLEFELGVPPKQALPQDFTFLTRIHYASPSDGMWGEHEMDYILFLQGDVSLKPNENEVQDVRYIKREDFSGFLDNLRKSDIPVTPWFHLISQKFLPLWWENLDKLDRFVDHDNIHRMINNVRYNTRSPGQDMQCYLDWEKWQQKLRALPWKITAKTDVEYKHKLTMLQGQFSPKRDLHYVKLTFQRTCMLVHLR